MPISELPREHVHENTSRSERIGYLKQYFLIVLAERPAGSTLFDREVLNVLQKLEKMYSNQ